MINVKIKFCPYCGHRLYLFWFKNPDAPDDLEEAGYACAFCGAFLDAGLEDL